jgi:hypothetical protein
MLAEVKAKQLADELVERKTGPMRVAVGGD